MKTHSGRCWIDPNRKPTKYGVVTWSYDGPNKKRSAHRVVYEWFYGVRLTRSQEILQICGNRACYRPSHLKDVGWIPRFGLAADPAWTRKPPKTLCNHGHTMLGENLYVSPRGVHFCRKCRSDSWRRYDDKQRRKRERFV